MPQDGRDLQAEIPYIFAVFFVPEFFLNLGYAV